MVKRSGTITSFLVSEIISVQARASSVQTCNHQVIQTVLEPGGPEYLRLK
jgi:hypothetical protein